MGASSSGWRTVPIDRGDVGVRIDRVLLRRLAGVAGVSRTRIQQWIARGDVLLNGAPVPRPAWRVAQGDELRVRLPEAPARRPAAAEPLPLDVVYEDEHLLAVNKPAGLVVHPSYQHASGTLLNALLSRTARPGLVHRLDKHTSGLVLVAKTRGVHTALHAMHGRGSRAPGPLIEKDYLAVVWGRPSPVRGTIDLALDRDPWDRRRVQVRDRGGQPSVTLYQRLLPTRGAGAGLSLVRCRLVTGRMHQIRVHLAARGWPIVGDPRYGTPPAQPLADAALDGLARGFGRQALHAWRLGLRHPITGERLDLEAPVPHDLKMLIEGIERSGGVRRGSERSG